RPQTLRASVDWSHELLSDAERLLFRRLAVFAGGWTLDAVERVCARDGLDAYAILDLLTSLVDKSLVLADEDHAAVRYRMLETVREYARALDAADPAPSSLRARALWGRGYLLAYAGAYESGIGVTQEALAAAEAVGDHSTTARALDALGTIRLFPDPIGCRPGVER